MLVTIIGLVAATCTTVSFLPQVIKIWKTKKTKDISFSMFLILGIGAFLWSTYGFLMKDPVIITPNVVIFILVLSILFFKIKHG